MPAKVRRFVVECKLGQALVDAINEDDAETEMELEYGRINCPYEVTEEVDLETTSIGMGGMFVHKTFAAKEARRAARQSKG